MVDVQRLPNIRVHVDAILGEPYAHFDCWALARHLLKAGLDLDLDANPQEAVQQVREVWFRGDARDPQTLVQPWDLLILATRGVLSNHLGIVVDPTTFVHTRRRCGVCVEPVPRWLSRLVQLGRLRMLM